MYGFESADKLRRYMEQHEKKSENFCNRYVNETLLGAVKRGISNITIKLTVKLCRCIKQCGKKSENPYDEYVNERMLGSAEQGISYIVIELTNEQSTALKSLGYSVTIIPKNAAFSGCSWISW
jgi:hypothetical protein